MLFELFDNARFPAIRFIRIASGGTFCAWQCGSAAAYFV
jgi:hypothetical protein